MQRAKARSMSSAQTTIVGVMFAAGIVGAAALQYNRERSDTPTINTNGNRVEVDIPVRNLDAGQIRDNIRVYVKSNDIRVGLSLRDSPDGSLDVKLPEAIITDTTVAWYDSLRKELHIDAQVAEPYTKVEVQAPPQ